MFTVHTFNALPAPRNRQAECTETMTTTRFTNRSTKRRDDYARDTKETERERGRGEKNVSRRREARAACARPTVDALTAALPGVLTDSALGAPRKSRRERRSGGSARRGKSGGSKHAQSVPDRLPCSVVDLTDCARTSNLSDSSLSISVALCQPAGATLCVFVCLHARIKIEADCGYARVSLNHTSHR